MEGTKMGQLARGADNDATLSPDMTRIAYWNRSPWASPTLSILSVLDGSQTKIPGSFPNGIGHAWSPDGDSIVVDTEGVIEVLDIDSGDRQLLLDCSEIFGGGDCTVVSWSPDGRGIAFGWHSGRSGRTDPRDGLYLLDASCVAASSGCHTAIRGPLLPGYKGVAWSPDSRRLAVRLYNKLIIFDAQTSSPLHETEMEEAGAWDGLAWSPDGQWLAYGDRGVIRLISPETGERRRLYSAFEDMGPVVFWITVDGMPAE